MPLPSRRVLSVPPPASPPPPTAAGDVRAQTDLSQALCGVGLILSLGHFAEELWAAIICDRLQEAEELHADLLYSALLGNPHSQRSDFGFQTHLRLSLGEALSDSDR